MNYIFLVLMTLILGGCSAVSKLPDSYSILVFAEDAQNVRYEYRPGGYTKPYVEFINASEWDFASDIENFVVEIGDGKRFSLSSFRALTETGKLSYSNSDSVTINLNPNKMRSLEIAAKNNFDGVLIIKFFESTRSRIGEYGIMQFRGPLGIPIYKAYSHVIAELYSVKSQDLIDSSRAFHDGSVERIGEIPSSGVTIDYLVPYKPDIRWAIMKSVKESLGDIRLIH